MNKLHGKAVTAGCGFAGGADKKDDAENMNQKFKTIWVVSLLLMVAVLAAGCKEETPYQRNDADNFNVSIKFDANGGSFTTTDTPAIVDAYNISEMAANSEGMVEIALLDPASTIRKDSFEVRRVGYFLAGWYTQRTQSGVDEEGNALYTYSGLWDFSSDMLSVDPNESHSSEDPVLTLYAAWVPEFKIEYYDLATGERISTVSLNPAKGTQITMPAWNKETGAQELNDVPKRSGYTFGAAYYDKAGTQPVDTETLTHPGEVDYETGTARNVTMQLYVDWMEGEWYYIYNVDQFLDNASVGGSYVICADLDFTDRIWPTSLMYGTYTGTIQGNGHSFSNISVIQNNNSKANAGLFGRLTESAAIRDLTLENVTFTIQAGTRVAGTTYGLLAGTVAEGAQIDGLRILDSTLEIDSDAYFGTSDYAIGLICGFGSVAVDPSGVTCVAVGDESESIVITLDGTEVFVEEAED